MIRPSRPDLAIEQQRQWKNLLENVVSAKRPLAWKAAQPSAKSTTKSALNAVVADGKLMGNFLSEVINRIVTNVMPKSPKFVWNVNNPSKAIALKLARIFIIQDVCVALFAMMCLWDNFSFTKISQFANEITSCELKSARNAGNPSSEPVTP